MDMVRRGSRLFRGQLPQQGALYLPIRVDLIPAATYAPLGTESDTPLPPPVQSGRSLPRAFAPSGFQPRRLSYLPFGCILTSWARSALLMEKFLAQGSPILHTRVGSTDACLLTEGCWAHGFCAHGQHYCGCLYQPPGWQLVLHPRRSCHPAWHWCQGNFVPVGLCFSVRIS